MYCFSLFALPDKEHEEQEKHIAPPYSFPLYLISQSKILLIKAHCIIKGAASGEFFNPLKAVNRVIWAGKIYNFNFWEIRLKASRCGPERST